MTIRVNGRPQAATDPRFADHTTVIENHVEASASFSEAFAQYTLLSSRQCTPAIGSAGRVPEKLPLAKISSEPWNSARSAL